MTSRDGRSGRLAWTGAHVAATAAVIGFHWRAAAPGMAFAGWDLRYFFYAAREATASALRAGELPGWQRGIFLGYPLIADPQAAVLDPATWLTLPWDAPRALTLATLLHLCLAAWGMIFWLRLRGLGAAEALLAALLFAIGAKETVHLQHWTFAASTAWWPWMLAGLEGFAERGRGRYVLLTAVASTFAWLGGSPQMAYFGTLVAGAYALVLAPRLWRRRRIDAALALAAAPLGLLLAAPIVLPIVELARHGPRGAGVDYRFVTSWKWPDRWGLALFVLPRAYSGDVAWGEMNLWEATGYLGILPLGLAAAAPLRRRACWLFAALAVVGIWLGFGEDAWLGLHYLLYRFLPGYASFRNPTRSLMVTSLASALLSAEALRALRLEADARRAARAAVALAAVVAAAVVLPRVPTFPFDRAAAQRCAVIAIFLALTGLAWLASRRWLRGTPWGARAWALVPIVVVFADEHAAFAGMNEVAPAAWQQPALPDLARFVPAAPAPRRVAVLASWGATSNAPLRRGWEGAAGYGPTVIERVRTLLEATTTDTVLPPSPITGDIDFPRPNPASALWPLLATPIVVSDEPERLPVLAPLKAEYESPLFETPTAAFRAQALPRVFWTGAWEAVGDERIAAPLLAAARGDRAVLAPDGPLADFPAPEPPSPGMAAERVSVDGGLVEAALSAPRAGVAVILEPWFPGWSATIDGASVPIARANFAFMAVPVPAGTHHLRLTYRNTQVTRGFALAAITLGSLCMVLVARRRTGRAASMLESESLRAA